MIVDTTYTPSADLEAVRARALQVGIAGLVVCAIGFVVARDHFFRAWLIGRGRHPYEAALKNPDSLADILDGDPVDGFGLDAASVRVYEEKTGLSDFYERLDREEKDLPPPPPEGDDWDFEDEAEMRKRFPKLCHLYLTPPEGDA